ncbi:hypothetical protein RBS60_10945 [Sinomonas sp. ASV486]|uniref:hypothetical protein n=1 Tax=Sinomonas sp. ASV486 TaxID=3051170 RepID=UPI0027DC4BA9|nr:hypothetical protein [Sinomonas sp. ASV486]MDQ4490714.1 hypothetical protein [Sinomonas sp. ASV486]
MYTEPAGWDDIPPNDDEPLDPEEEERLKRLPWRRGRSTGHQPDHGTPSWMTDPRIDPWGGSAVGTPPPSGPEPETAGHPTSEIPKVRTYPEPTHDQIAAARADGWGIVEDQQPTIRTTTADETGPEEPWGLIPLPEPETTTRSTR